MTTAAYRNEILAADSQMTGRGGARIKVKKIRRLKDGSLYCGSGTAAVINKMERWLDGGKEPEIGEDDEVEAILIKSDGTVWLVDEDLELEQVEDEFTAIGTGAGIAIGAMACGKTAEEAVEIAAKHDSGTSLPVHTMKLKE